MVQFIGKFDPKTVIDVKSVRHEIDQLLTEKLEFLTANRVKKVRTLHSGVACGTSHQACKVIFAVS